MNKTGVKKQKKGTPFHAQHFTIGSLATLKSRMDLLSVKAGSLLFSRKDPAKNFYLIKTGEVNLSATVEEGKECILSMLAKGDMFGAWASVPSMPCTYNAYTVTDCDLYVIDHQELERLLRQEPILTTEFLRWSLLMERIAKARLRDLSFQGKRGAVCATLVRLSKSYGKQEGKDILITRKIKNKEIGNYTGCSRESVNRMLSDMKKRGVLSQKRGYIIIHDLNYLKQECHCEECPMGVCRI